MFKYLNSHFIIILLCTIIGIQIHLICLFIQNMRTLLYYSGKVDPSLFEQVQQYE